MFQNPGDNLLLFKTYSVDYVMVSAYETGNFSADEAALSKYFTCVYDENGIRLYKVPALLSRARLRGLHAERLPCAGRTVLPIRGRAALRSKQPSAAKIIWEI